LDRAVLAVWLDERAGLPHDPLFPTRTGRRLTRDAVERRVATHVAAAAQRCPSLAGKRVHPHVLRHSCAMSLLQARVDSTVTRSGSGMPTPAPPSNTSTPT
jgi:site-specific recombinase XerC